jgi:ADP-ribose pyrophosphatase
VTGVSGVTGYRVLRTIERFRNRVFTLITDVVGMPDGTEAERDYLHHVGAVGVVALDDEGRVVLVRQYRHALRDELWELPAGLIDVEGEPLVAAAARELAEEADLRAARWDLLADVHTSPGCSDERIRLFLAQDLTPVPEPERHRRTFEEAGMTVHRVPLDEAVAMARRGEITNAACLIGVLTARDLGQSDTA